MKWALLKFTTKEGSKAAYEDRTFRIQNVIFVTSLLDTASKRRDENPHRKKQPKDFESALKQACTKKEQKEIAYTASGYTRTGMPFHYFEKRREYL